MKKKLLRMEELALMIFDDEGYDIFIEYIDTNQINSARLFLNNVSDAQDIESDAIRSKVFNELEDMLIDLIIMEIDGGEWREKQDKQGTG